MGEIVSLPASHMYAFFSLHEVLRMIESFLTSAHISLLFEVSAQIRNGAYVLYSTPSLRYPNTFFG